MLLKNNEVVLRSNNSLFQSVLPQIQSYNCLFLGKIDHFNT